jgi:hypothetical protein
MVDGRGRWSTARLDGRFLRRTLDSRVIGASAVRAIVAPDALHDTVAALAARFHGEIPEPALALAARWDVAAHLAERARHRAAYPERVSILPPDRYGDVVVQPAVGCPSGRCTFCAFYRGSRFRALGDPELDAHLDAVVDLHGPALDGRPGVWLGSASAASLSTARLLQVLDRVRRAIGDRRRGVAAFWDPDHAPCRGSNAWRVLREAGLVRVYVGLESGHAPLRARWGKSPDLNRLRGRVEQAVAAGVAMGVMVLDDVGFGGEAHHDDTVAELTRWPLGPGDRVFVSPLLMDSGPTRPTARSPLAVALRASLSAQVASYNAARFEDYA